MNETSSSSYLEKSCRTCMSTRINSFHHGGVKTMRSIFDKPNGWSDSPITIIELLQSVQPQLQIDPNDKLPKFMCLGCLEHLQITYEFLRMSSDADQKFRKLLIAVKEEEESVDNSDDVVIIKEEYRIDEHEENGFRFEITQYENDAKEDLTAVGNQYTSFHKGGTPDDRTKFNVRSDMNFSNFDEYECDDDEDCDDESNSMNTSAIVENWRTNKQTNIRKLGPSCKSTFCQKSNGRHCQEFDEKTRRSIFDKFWKMTLPSMRLFVSQHVVQVPVKRSGSKSSKKKFTFEYTLPYEKRKKLQVCRSMFISTLSISESMTRRWLIKYSR